MKGFGYVDEPDSVSGSYRLVESSGAADMHYRAPVGIFLQGGGYLGLPFQRHDPADIALGRILQAEAVVEANQVKDPEISRGRHERPVEGVGMPSEGVYAAGEFPYGLQKFRLVRLPVAEKDFLRLVAVHLELVERKVGVDYFLNFLFNGLHLPVCHIVHIRVAVFLGVRCAEFAIKTAR